MTESAFPFGAATDEESEAQQPVEHSDETRTNILIGAGGALAAIAMAAGFMVFAGGEDTADLTALPATPGSTAAPAPKPSPVSSTPPRIEPAPVAEPVGRDPFAPLYRPPVPVTTPAPGVGTIGVVPVTGGTGSVPTAGAPVGGTTTGGTTGTPQQPTPVDPKPVSHQLRMVRVYQTGGVWHAELTLDGRVYRPAVGETFAESFQLVSTQDSCGTYLFGDERFDLCVGEITVRQQ